MCLFHIKCQGESSDVGLSGEEVESKVVLSGDVELILTFHCVQALLETDYD